MIFGRAATAVVRRRLLGVTFTAVLLVSESALASSPQRLVLNEVLYDAEGADGGHEFIELMNAGTASSTLAGVIIERGNGSRAGDWRQVWSGSDGDTLGAAEFYVVGGAHVVPEPDARVDELGLQNGPDACRLRVDGRVVDVVGWGQPLGAEFAEATPAVDVPAGSSLGRVPDGIDRDDNSRDWQRLDAPSPGAPNRAALPFRVAVPRHRSRGRLVFDVEVEWELSWLASWTSRDIELSVIDCVNQQFLASPRLLDAGDDGAHGTLVLRGLPPGRLEMCVVVAAGGLRDTLAVPIRVGPGPLRITEIMARPAPGDAEWVEVINAGAEPLAIADYALADARSEPRALAADDVATDLLGPGQLAVIAADSVPGVTARLSIVSPWPTLNDAGDRVRILDDAGRTSDDVEYDGEWMVAGASLARLDPDLPSEDPVSWIPGRPPSPGVAPEPLADAAQFIDVSAPMGASGPLLLTFAEPLRRGFLRIYRTDGRRIFELEGAALAGRTQVVWRRRTGSGEPLPPGLYLVVVEGRSWRADAPVAQRTTLSWIARPD